MGSSGARNAVEWLASAARDPEAVIGSFAADHVIPDAAAFHGCVAEAVDVARDGHVVTIGIEPMHPSTGFGYIQMGSAIAGAPTARRVRQFVEKPDARRAAAYLSTGEFRWNAGMFVVRAGILAVSKGQSEAAGSLGLRPGQTLRLVVIPQAMRVIIPPLTSQYLNLTKNSSLAVAIGYPDLVQVFMGTVLNQTGQAIEVVVITMAVYLAISLATSFVMNIYNRRVAIVER